MDVRWTNGGSCSSRLIPAWRGHLRIFSSMCCSVGGRLVEVLLVKVGGEVQGLGIGVKGVVGMALHHG